MTKLNRPRSNFLRSGFFRYSVSTWFLFVAVVSVSIGWYLDRSTYQDFGEYEISGTRLVGPIEETIEVASAFEYWVLQQQNPKAFDQYLRARVAQVINVLFLYEKELNRLQFDYDGVPDSIQRAKDVARLAGFSDLTEAHEFLSSNLNKSGQSGTVLHDMGHLNDPTSKQYERFREFLSRVFEDNNQLDSFPEVDASEDTSEE